MHVPPFVITLYTRLYTYRLCMYVPTSYKFQPLSIDFGCPKLQGLKSQLTALNRFEVSEVQQDTIIHLTALARLGPLPTGVVGQLG